MAHFITSKKPRMLLLFLIVTLPFLIGIAYLIGFNQQAHASIILDNTSNSNGVSSWVHTVNAPNTILVVGVDAASSVTVGGQALTRAVGSNTTSSVWYFKNPPVGNVTIVVTGSTTKHAAAATFANVDLANPIGTTGSNNFGASSNFCQNNQSTDWVISSASTGQGLVLFGGPMSPTNTSQLGVDFYHVVMGKAQSTFAAGSGQTALMTFRVTGNKESVGMSTKPATNSNTTMQWSIGCPPGGSSSGNISGAAIALNYLAPSPTPTPTPTPTATPTPTPTPTPAPIVGNITNLNFGISNSSPWIQVTCGDLRMDGGVTNAAPAGQNMITTNATCASPGLVFTGETNASFGQGQASSSNQVVGGATYPEVYSPPGGGGIFSSYSSLLAKAQSSTTPPTDLSTVCTLSNCTLPANLTHGVYVANGDVVLNAYNFSANANYVFLIHGNLTLNGNIITPAGSNSSVLFSTSGNIIVPPTVGSAPGVTTANLSGIFSTDKSFIMQSGGNCTDLRLNIEGTIIVNAGRTGGTLQNNRDLCGSNATSPTLALTQRLDFILNLPDFAKEQSVTSQEVAP